MRYHNTTTGAILESDCVLNGGDWEEVSAEKTRRSSSRSNTKEKKAEEK